MWFLTVLALLKTIVIYRLDLYIPKDHSKPHPVVAFVTGGAWIIGWVKFSSWCMTKSLFLCLPLFMIILLFSYKAWGALLGRRLAERGIMVACIDYRCLIFMSINLCFPWLLYTSSIDLPFLFDEICKYVLQKFPSRNNRWHGHWCFWGNRVYLWKYCKLWRRS